MNSYSPLLAELRRAIRAALGQDRRYWIVRIEHGAVIIQAVRPA